MFVSIKYHILLCSTIDRSPSFSLSVFNYFCNASNKGKTLNKTLFG